MRDVVRVAQWWSEQPAKLAGLWYSKGSLEAGKDADFTVWRPREPAMVTPPTHTPLSLASSLFLSLEAGEDAGLT